MQMLGGKKNVFGLAFSSNGAEAQVLTCQKQLSPQQFPQSMIKKRSYFQKLKKENKFPPSICWRTLSMDSLSKPIFLSYTKEFPISFQTLALLI